MFSPKKSNNLTNRIHERSLRIISEGKQSVFQIWLENRNQLTIHQRNFQALMIEIYKMANFYAPPIMENLFVFRENVRNIINF